MGPDPSQHGTAWLPSRHPSFAYSLPGTLILVASSVVVWWGERGVRAGRPWQLLAGIGGAAVMGAVFVGVELAEWAGKPFSISSGGYGSFFFTITGFHMAHVIAGVIALAAVSLWSLAGYFTPRRHAHVSIVALYWHFVDVVWLAVFTAFYIAPYLAGDR